MWLEQQHERRRVHVASTSCTPDPPQVEGHEPMNLQQAMKNPMRVFGTPETLEASTDFTAEAKRLILLQWKDQLQQLLTADDEGMVRGNAIPDDNAECLRHIIDIQTRLTPP
jgi:hypothetical protein